MFRRFACSGWLMVCVSISFVSLSIPSWAAQGDDDFQVDTFERQKLDDTYYSEGANFGDLNQDGHMDIVYGPYWFAGPDFDKKYTIYEPVPQNREGYADHFFAWVHDFNQDDAPDVFVVGFPGTPAYVYENPKDPENAKSWNKHEVFDWVSNESPQFVDLIGDELPELVCTRDGFFGFAVIDPAEPLGRWTFYPVSEKITAARFGHGLGVGDVNGDGKQDIIHAAGWYEQPQEEPTKGRWVPHLAKFSQSYGGADMFAYDVDGDGDNDVITSEAAHDFGLAWYEQLPTNGNGEAEFKQHLIMGGHPAENNYGVVFSELHSVNLVDMDGDGLKDIVTGKTYYSHHQQSPMWNTGAVVYWFRLVRTDEGVDWVPYLADGEAGIGRQLVVGDLNDDGLPDMVLGGMKGAHVLIHQRSSGDEEAWKKVQPKPYEGEPLPTTEGMEAVRGPVAEFDEESGRWSSSSGIVQLEGEELDAKPLSGSVSQQAMDSFKSGQWSNGKQLFWTGARPGDKLQFTLPELEGKYDLELIFTCARDYGVVELKLDDEVLGPPIDLYDPNVITTGVITFSDLDLAAGEHTLQVRILGKNPQAAAAFMFGIDALRFVPQDKDSKVEATFDCVILNGRIVDGTGAPWYRADIGILNGRILKIGRIKASEGRQTIDAEGMIVAPGFVDMMGQTATVMMERPQQAMNLLTQGITTINSGEGGSAAPLPADQDARQGWTTMREYFALLEMQGLPINVVQTIGHTRIREMVIGEDQRRPSESELKEMQALVREAMEAGAIGVSTALIYPPAVYADTEEIGSLAEVAGEYGGRYFTHMRNEGDQLLEAIDEALAIGERGKTPVHIFHLKAAGQQNWHKMKLALEKISDARKDGRQVTADIYPYVNNGLGIAALIHPRHFAEGYDKLRGQLDEQELRQVIRQEMEETEGWENWFRHVDHDWNRIVIGQTSHRRYSKYGGKTLAEIAHVEKEDPWDVFFELVKSGAFALPQSMSEENKKLAMQAPFISYCTDVGPASGSQIAAHPRAFGAFPRLLGNYVRDQQVISLEKAVAQASAAAHNVIMVYDRGRIAEGLAADVIVFDQEQIQDLATFSQPDQLSRGVEHVLVNGQLVLKNGKYTGARPGRVLRGPGFKRERAPYAVANGPNVEEMSSYDRMMEQFLKEHRLVGAAVAVTDKGRLVHAKGYGYADLGQLEEVTPQTRFRIASISKPITAVAILQLVEQGKLSLDDRIFDVLAMEDAIAQLNEGADSQLSKITVEHLLQHRGGWDRDQSFDAMFRSVPFAHRLKKAAPADAACVIEAMLSQSLDFEPGEKYAYSNFGYCLLGRAIEKVTGQDYESYVQDHVLKPLGITEMQIGKTHLSGRQKNETRYYHPGHSQSVFEESLDQAVPDPYGAWYLEAMDSHGGWIASAVDLARFAAAFDDPENCPLLSAESIALMYGRPEGLAGYTADGKPKSSFYSLGWFNRPVDSGRAANHWHTGSLPGTAAILIQRHDGKNFVALMNSRVSPTGNHLGRMIDPLLHQAAGEVQTWPEIDLFEKLP